MDRERYLEIQRNMRAKLTPEEKVAGWSFCPCEWDGMLIHKNSVEAEFCYCQRIDAKGE